MEIAIKGEAKEIAALVLAVQERQRQKIVIKEDTGAKMPEECATLASAIRGVLLEAAEQSQSQQPEATERIQNQDVESRSDVTVP